MSLNSNVYFKEIQHLMKYASDLMVDIVLLQQIIRLIHVNSEFRLLLFHKWGQCLPTDRQMLGAFSKKRPLLKTCFRNIYVYFITKSFFEHFYLHFLHIYILKTFASEGCLYLFLLFFFFNQYYLTLSVYLKFSIYILF